VHTGIIHRLNFACTNDHVEKRILDDCYHTTLKHPRLRMYAAVKYRRGAI